MSGFTAKDFSSLLLSPYGVDCNQLVQILSSKHPQSADFSELYLQRSVTRAYGYEESRLKTIDQSTSMGCGARVVKGTLTGFAYCDSFDAKPIAQALDMAAAIASHGASGNAHIQTRPPQQAMYEPIATAEVSTSSLISLFAEIDTMARAMPYVERCELSLATCDDLVLVLNTLGTCQADMRPLWRLQVRLVLHRKNQRESGSSGLGGRHSFSLSSLRQDAQTLVADAHQQALINLDAQPCKAGPQTVVLGSGWPGVLLHEAVGHGLEADFNRKQTSIYSNRIGEQVAAKTCTVIDNGTMRERRGSLFMDDEGTATGENVLIENGILRGYMQDMQNALLMGQSLTGNARRESYAHVPMPRMTNTYMLAGEHDPQEIIESVDQGIYAVNFNGGQVDITSGNFVFNSSLAYKIEKGRVTHPIKGASLIGNGPEIMQKISMVGNDLSLDPGIGVCGKEGQSVPVGVGQPTMKISEIVVGGQS